MFCNTKNLRPDASGHTVSLSICILNTGYESYKKKINFANIINSQIPNSNRVKTF